MKAFVIALISASREPEDIKNAKVRIYDFSPSATNRLMDYPLNLVKDALREKRIELEDISFNRKSDEKNSQFGLYYLGIPVEKVLPVLRNKTSISRKLIALDVVNEAIPKIVITDCTGNAIKAPLVDIALKYREKITNIGLTTKKSDDAIPYIEFNNKKIIITKLNGESFFKVQFDNNTIKNSSIGTGWISVDQFKQSAQAMNLDYEFTNNDKCVHRYDSRVSDINIPVGITDIDKILTNEEVALKNKTFNSIRIPGTCTNIQCNAFKGIQKIDNIIWQNKVAPTTLQLDGFNELMANGGVSTNLNKTFDIGSDIINYLCNFTGLNTVSLQSNLDSLSVLRDNRILQSSFVNVNFNGTVKLPSSIQNITYSFNKCGQVKLDVTNIKQLANCFNEQETTIVGDVSSFLSISESFNSISNKILDLSSAKNLKSIRKSFNDCPNLEEVRLPKSVDVRECFNNCPKLNKVVIEQDNDKITIVQVSFKNTAVSNIDVYGKVQFWNSFNNFTEYNVLNDGVSFGTWATIEGQTIKLPEIEKIRRDIFVSATLYLNITLGESTRLIEKDAFNNAEINVLNLYNTKIKKISDSAFQNCKIGTLVLPKETTNIDVLAFACARITNILIPSTVETIDKTAFNGIMNKINGGAVTVYHSAQSITELISKRIKAITFNKFNSDDEAYNAILGLDSISSQNAIAKAKLILVSSSDEIHQEMTKPQYINNIDLFRTIYSKLKGSSPDTKEVILDTSKLCNIRISATQLDYYLHNKSKSNADGRSAITNEISVAPSNAEYTNTFAAYANVIARFMHPASHIKTLKDIEDFIDNYFERGKCYVYLDILYKDACSSICCIRLVNSSQTSILGSTELHLVVINTNNVITFVGAEQLSDGNCRGIRSMFGLYNNTNPCELYKLDNIPENSCETFNIIKDNTTIYIEDRKWYVGAVEFPEKLSRLLVSNFIEHTVVIGIENNTSAYPVALLMSLPDGTIYKAKVTPSRPLRNSHITSIKNNFKSVIIEKIFNSIDNLGPAEIVLIDDMIGNDASTYMYRITNYESVLDRKKNNPNAYTKLEACYDWKLGAALHKSGVKSIGDLSSQMVQAILESGFYSKILRKIDKPDRSASRFTTTDGIQVETWFYDRDKRAISSMYGLNAKYITKIVSGSKETWYASNVEPKTALMFLLSMVDMEANPVWDVDNNIYNDKDFFDLDIDLNFDVTSNYYKKSIQVCKSTGAIFITVSRHGELAVIFRVEDTESAKKLMKKMYSTNNIAGDQSICDGCEDIGRYILTNKAGYTVNKPNTNRYYWQFREKILDGLPKGIPFSGSFKEFESWIARQKKES